MTTQNLVPLSSGGVGNTNQSTPLTHWFFTWNNYSEEDISSIVPWIREKCKQYHFQEEKGLNNTLHLQGSLSFKQKTRFESLHRTWPKIHWEKTRCQAANNYCMKPSFDGARRWSSTVIIETFRPSHAIFDEVENLMTIKPNPRTIYWFYDTIGGIGKSAFSKYMYIKYNEEVTVVTTNKSNDILTAITGKEKLVIMDFPRCTDIAYTPYRAIEEIKNGFITDCKLKKKARVVCFNSPHVVVFSNDKPDTTKLSKDRWYIKEFTTELESMVDSLEHNIL